MPNEYNFKQDPIAFILQGLAHANPEYRAKLEQRKRDREARKFELKRQELLNKARESLWKKQADAQARKEEQKRKAEATRKRDALVDIKALIAKTRSQQGAVPRQAALPAGHPLAGTRRHTPDRPTVASQPPTASKQDILLSLLSKAKDAGLSDAGVKTLLETEFPETKRTDKPAALQIKIDEARKLGATDEQLLKMILKGGGTTINNTPIFNDPNALPKTSRTKIVDSLIDVRQSEASFDRARSLYQSKFSKGEFQVSAQAKRIIRRWDTAEKAINFVRNAFGRPDIKLRDKDQENYVRWRFETDMMFFKMRRFITGVAGGFQEMAEIKRFLPTKTDPPLDYWNKFNQWNLATQNIGRQLEQILSEGIQRGEFTIGSTFENIPQNVRDEVVIRAFGEAELELRDFTPEIAQQQRDKQFDGITGAP